MYGQLLFNALQRVEKGLLVGEDLSGFLYTVLFGDIEYKSSTLFILYSKVDPKMS